MAVTAPDTQIMTVEEYLALPEDFPRCEVLDGEIYMLPSPNRNHQWVVRKLVGFFDRYLNESPVGEVYSAPFDTILEAITVVQPDVLFVCNETVEEYMKDRLYGPPDLAVEILSPSNAMRDLTSKRDKYHKHRIRELWFIDPAARTVSVDRLESDGETYARPQFYTEEQILSSPLLPGLEIPVSVLFVPENGRNSRG